MLTRRLPQALLHAVALAVACLLSYALTTGLLARVAGVDHENDLLGGMWAVIATVFVYRLGHQESVRAARSRGVATAAGFVLCLGWLSVLPPGVVGLVVLIGVGTAVLLLLGRADDVVTTGVTVAVVMVVAALGPPEQAWAQPFLRSVDTAVGVLVGLAATYAAHLLSDYVVAENRRR